MDVTLEYPILYFCKDDTLLFTETDEENFTRVRSRSLRSSYFKKFYVVDSKGNGYRLKSVTKIGYLPPFLGWFIGDVRINLEFEKPVRIDLNELKDHVLRVINGDIDYWDSTVGRDVEDLKTSIRNAKSTKELIGMLQ
jgi:hypothetical protein